MCGAKSDGRVRGGGDEKKIAEGDRGVRRQQERTSPEIQRWNNTFLWMDFVSPVRSLKGAVVGAEAVFKWPVGRNPSPTVCFRKRDSLLQIDNRGPEPRQHSGSDGRAESDVDSKQESTKKSPKVSKRASGYVERPSDVATCGRPCSIHDMLTKPVTSARRPALTFKCKTTTSAAVEK